MIGVDTNLLLRVVLDDDPDQAAMARLILNRAAHAGESIRIDRVVLCELVWTLQRRLGYPRTRIADLVEDWLVTIDYLVEDDEIVAEAVTLFRTSRCGFADILIGLLNRRAGCSTIYTFDHEAAALESFTAVPPA